MSTFTTDSLLTCSRYSANPGYQRFAFSTETQKTRCEMIVTTKRLSSKAGHVIHVPINLYLAIYLSKSLRSVRSLKNGIVFFSKDVIHWSINLLQKFKLFCFVCLCFFSFIKESWKKCITVYTKMLSSTTVYYHSYKCFLSSKSAYYNDFWRNLWHWSLEI